MTNSKEGRWIHPSPLWGSRCQFFCITDKKESLSEICDFGNGLLSIFVLWSLCVAKTFKLCFEFDPSSHLIHF